MSVILTELRRETESNGVVVVSDNKWDKKVRGEGTGVSFNRGDIFIIPKDYKVLADPKFKIRRRVVGTEDEYEEVPVRFTLAEMMDRRDPTKSLNKAVRIYPSMFDKSIFTVKKVDGVLRHDTVLRPQGDVCTLFREFVDVDDAMDAIAGRPIKVDVANEVPIAKFQSEEDRKAGKPLEPSKTKHYTLNFLNGVPTPTASED